MITYRFIWDRQPNIEFFEILRKSKACESSQDIIIYSCFNYATDFAEIEEFIAQHTKAKTRIYYSGERFVDEINANIIVSFLPQKPPPTSQGSYIAEIINVLQPYNNSTKMRPKLSEIKYEGRQFIMLRDQERTLLEIYAKNGKWSPGLPINIYTDLTRNWSTSQPIAKKRFCCFIVSNPGCIARNKFFELLCKYKAVDSLGKYMPNIPADIIYVPARVNEQDEYIKLLSQYKFMITFENNSLAYYNTEKIFNAFMAGTVPIYWGDPLIDAVYNPACFIWVKTHESPIAQFAAFRAAIEQVKAADNSPEIYAQYFAQPLMLNPAQEDKRLEQSVCDILDQL